MIDKALLKSDHGREPGTDQADASLPVFMQSWWLDAASTERPSTTIKAMLGGRLAGRLVYVTHRNKIGSKLGFPPFWSHLGGPILEPGLDPVDVKEALRQIVLQLPRDTSFRFACDPNAEHIQTVCREFTDHGFWIEHDPTYLVFPDESDILGRMKSRHRAQIRSAGKQMTIVAGDAGRFIEFYRANLPTRSHSPLSTARHIIETGIRKGQMCVLFALNGPANDRGDPIDAAIACAWDASRYYYWMSRRRMPQDNAVRPNPEATKLLILRAIRHAQSLGLVFDADSPESMGGRGLFTTLFGIKHVEQRPILVRKTRLTRAYDGAVPVVKRLIRRVMPGAPIYDPRSTLNHLT